LLDINSRFSDVIFILNDFGSSIFWLSQNCMCDLLSDVPALNFVNVKESQICVRQRWQVQISFWIWIGNSVMDLAFTRMILDQRLWDLVRPLRDLRRDSRNVKNQDGASFTTKFPINGGWFSWWKSWSLEWLWTGVI
jgi:hypothetical protein